MSDPLHRSAEPSQITVKVLVLAKYANLAATTRHRFVQYFPALREAGIECQIEPLLPDGYLRAKYSGEPFGWLALAACYLRRLRTLAKVRNFDVVVIHYELFPYLPAWFERFLAMAGIPFVLDIDDPVYLHYAAHHSPIIRAVLGKKIAALARLAAVTQCGSRPLLEFCRTAGGRPTLVPTVVDEANFTIPQRQPSDEFRILWIGTPSTGPYLEVVRPALETLASKRRFRLVVVGAHNFASTRFIVETHPWSEEQEREQLARCDVGIMPLSDDAWSAGKCGFKLIQYMAAGLAVVASPVGANLDIVRPGHNGFLAANHDEWVQALATLADDVQGRERLGINGRRLLEKELSFSANLLAIQRNLLDAAASA